MLAGSTVAVEVGTVEDVVGHSIWHKRTLSASLTWEGDLLDCSCWQAAAGVLFGGRGVSTWLLVTLPAFSANKIVSRPVIRARMEDVCHTTGSATETVMHDNDYCTRTFRCQTWPHMLSICWLEKLDRPTSLQRHGKARASLQYPQARQPVKQQSAITDFVDQWIRETPLPTHQTAGSLNAPTGLKELGGTWKSTTSGLASEPTQEPCPTV